MIYFDTAYLAKCYLNEHGSGEVRDLALSDGRVSCCEYGRVELAATFHRNLRQKTIIPSEFRMIWNQFDLDEEKKLWTWLPLDSELLADVTARFRKLSPTVYLRSADAMHLACGGTRIQKNPQQRRPHFGSSQGFCYQGRERGSEGFLKGFVSR